MQRLIRMGMNVVKVVGCWLAGGGWSHEKKKKKNVGRFFCLLVSMTENWIFDGFASSVTLLLRLILHFRHSTMQNIFKVEKPVKSEPGTTFVLKGFIGPSKHLIEGTYVYTDKMSNNCSVYVNERNPDITLEYLRDSWAVRNAEQRAVNIVFNTDETKECFARVKTAGRGEPDTAPASLWDECGPGGGKNRFVRNTNVQVIRTRSSSIAPQQSNNDLPTGYISKIDPKSGKTFYVNTATGQSYKP